MPANYVLLEKISVGAAGASSVTFSSIPQSGYTDLKLVYSARTNRSPDTVDNTTITFNGTSTANQTTKQLYGTNNTASSGSGTGFYYQMVTATGATALTFGSVEVYIPNYTSANYKSISSESAAESNSATAAWLMMEAGLWSNTAAITSIVIAPTAGTSFDQYSTFYLYGVAKLGTTPAIVPYATGGDTIMTDGTYWYHAFLSSGTFTPQKGLSCDVLVVAGGGGSSQHQGGGGGAGGLLGFTSQTITSGAKTVTVGAGGTGVVSSANGGNGSDSQFASLTLVKGGGGGGDMATAGSNGGSGGGGGGLNTGVTGSTAGGSGTSSQGYAGGLGYGSSSAIQGWQSGGGGGAGAVGQSGTGGAAGGGICGAGGVGVNTYSTWASATSTGVSGYYAGGGGGGGNSGGGSGGSGGGGTGAGGSGNGNAGTANTGGGAGGAGNGTVAQNGGSGIVIVRYPV